MKVLHIISGLDNGGAETVLYRLTTDRTVRCCHEVVSLVDLGYYGQRLMDAGVPVHILQLHQKKAISALMSLYRLIRSVNPDVIQTWMYHADLVGGLVALLARKRTVVWGIHDNGLNPRQTKLRTRLVASICAGLSYFLPRRIICCSESALSAHAKKKYCSSKMVVIHNGLDLDLFQPDPHARAGIRSELALDHDQVVFGMVARWDPYKDHGNLIAALMHSDSKLPPRWRCLLVGRGMQSDNHDLVALLDQCDARQRFELLGVRDDIPAIMNALDLHLLSSSEESFGNVTIEAMACGVPAVTTSAGPGELIVGNTGWVVPPANPEALGEAIVDAIGAIAARESWKGRQDACRARVLEYFSVEHMSNQYHQVWSSICSG